MPTPFKLRVKVASVKTLYALVQIRAAWRDALSGPTTAKVPAVPLETPPLGAESSEVLHKDEDNQTE